MGATRVPRKDSLFDGYIRSTGKVLAEGTPTGADRLGLSSAQATAWATFLANWIIIYGKYQDKAQRTTAVTDDKNQLKTDFIAFAVTPLKVIEVSPNLTSDDRLTFNLPAPDKVKTTRGKIQDSPFGKLKSKGLGLLDVQVRREHDASRPSLHKLSDAVEFKYKIIDPEEEPSPTPVPPAPGTGGDSVPLPKDMPLSHISKKASWRMDLGETAVGKRIVGYVRWVNLSDPGKNSGWSDLLTTQVT
jgi:hypothetical protein